MILMFDSIKQTICQHVQYEFKIKWKEVYKIKIIKL